MNTLKCPLCGNPLKLSTIENKGKLHFYACYKCNYQLRMSPSQDFALEYAKIFIFKFPPIMRVNVGDRILYNSCDDDYLAKVNDICRDKNNDVYLKVVILDSGDEDDVEAYQIIRWPWELEQKGGAEQ